MRQGDKLLTSALFSAASADSDTDKDTWGGGQVKGGRMEGRKRAVEIPIRDFGSVSQCVESSFAANLRVREAR